MTGERLLDVLLASDSRFETGVECALDSTNETLRSRVCQYIFSDDYRRRTVLFERLNDVFQLLSRYECVFTCSLLAGQPLTSRTAVSSSTRAWRSWKMAGSTMPDCDDIAIVQVV